MTTTTTDTPTSRTTAPRFDLVLTERQTQAWDALCDPSVRAVCYGGAKGGGKSVLLCAWVYWSCCDLIRRYGLTPGRYPLPVGFMGRVQGIDFKNTTLETWKSIIPAAGYTLREGDQEIVIGDAVKIDYGGLDRTDAVNKFNSAEYILIAIDQAEETNRDTVAVLRGSLRRSIGGRHEPFKELYTANPAQCWLKDEFIDQTRAGRRFIQALPRDNEHLPADYLETLRSAFRHRPELLEAYLEGSWQAFEDPMQIIRSAWITAAFSRVVHRGSRLAKYVVCDVARFGDDRITIFDYRADQIVGGAVHGQMDLHRLSNMLHRRALDTEADAVVVDGEGLGAGVVDNLRALSAGAYAVVEFLGSARAADDARFVNLRAEAWWTAGQALADGEVGWVREVLERIDPELESQLRAELCAVRYEFRNGRIKVEAKDDIKDPDRLGRSPDLADNVVMALWAWKTDRVRPRGDRAGRRQYERSRRRRTGGSGSFMAA